MFREAAALAIVLCIAAPARAQQGRCRSVCMPDETHDRSGCCVPMAIEATELDPAIGCSPGMRRTAQTQGECCWPGQAFGDGRCRGLPASCPAGHVARNERCELIACEAGHVRAGDGLTCCWPGQIATNGSCRGVPTSCPANYDIVGERCSDARHRAALAQSEQARIAAEQQAAIARAARDRAEYDARLAAYNAEQASVSRARAIDDARAPVFGGPNGVYFGASLATALPPVFESFLYLAPRATLMVGIEAFEILAAAGWAVGPDDGVSAFSVHAQMGLALLSYPNAQRSAWSFINLAVGPFGDMWVGDGIPDDLTVFGGAFVANTVYLGCVVAVRVQYSQTIFGLHGPVSPSLDVHIVFGSRTVQDPEGECR